MKKVLTVCAAIFVSMLVGRLAYFFLQNPLVGPAEASVVHSAEVTDFINESVTLELRASVPINEGRSGILLKYCDTETRRYVYTTSSGGVSASDSVCD
jgi:hypothetical protein